MKPRSLRLFIVISLLPGLLMAFAGCGSNNSASTVTVVSDKASTECIICHAGNSKSVSSVSGVSITDEWQLSAHNTAHGAGCLDCHSNAHYHDNQFNCRDCHATAHTNNGTSCSLCHGGSSSNAADCRSCHATIHKDPSSCNRCHGGAIPVDVAMKNPDFAGKCFGCHKNGNNFKRYSVAARHFNNFTGAGNHPAMYVPINYQNSCTSCHEPHNPLLGLGSTERKAWAQSGHGDVNGAGWAGRDFKKSVGCIRCHTTTGYINYVQSNFTLPTTTWATAGDNSREVLTCKGCHLTTNFQNSIRRVEAFTTTYTANGGSNMIPDVEESNLCIPCHTGRAGQADIDVITDFTNVSYKNAHHMPAAGVMYMKTGFTKFTSATAIASGTTTYGTTYSLPLPLSATGTIVKGGVDAIYGGVLGGVGSAHRALGTPSTRGGETWMKTLNINGLWEKKGPCVTCHIKADITAMPKFTGDVTKPPFLDTTIYGSISSVRSDSGHTLAISPSAAKQVCIPCHNDEGGLGDPATAVELKNEEAKPYFDAGVAAITKLFLDNYNIKFNGSFYDLTADPSGKTTVKDWTRGRGNNAAGNAFGKKLMGAAYNLKMFSDDKAAYVHGRTYSQRLIFDTIDFLDDGKMNKSAAATLVSLSAAISPPDTPNLFPSTTADHWLFKANGVRK